LWQICGRKGNIGENLRQKVAAFAVNLRQKGAGFVVGRDRLNVFSYKIMQQSINTNELKKIITF